MRLGETLDRRADVAEASAGLDLFDPLHQRVVGDVDQPCGIGLGRPGQVHPRAVAVPAVDDHRHVDVEDVAVDQHVVGSLFLILAGRDRAARNAVADHMVDRDAAGVTIPLVADRRRGGAGGPDHIVHRGVEVQRGDAGDDQRRHAIEDVGHQPAGSAHALEIRGVVNADAVPVQAAGQGSVQGSVSEAHYAGM